MTTEPLEEAEVAYQHLKDAGQLAAKRLNSLWDAEARVYRNPEEVKFLHALVNEQVLAMNPLNRLIRTLKAQEVRHDEVLSDPCGGPQHP